MTLELLLAHVLTAARAREIYAIPKTKLLKLAYLSEVLQFRKTRERLLSDDWVYYLFGPYVFGYDKLLESRDFERSMVVAGDSREATLISLAEDASPPSAEPSLRATIESVVERFGRASLDEVLNYVYFDTEPMLDAVTRGQVLAFDTIQPAAYYRVRPLKPDPKKKAAILRQLRERVRQGNVRHI